MDPNMASEKSNLSGNQEGASLSSSTSHEDVEQPTCSSELKQEAAKEEATSASELQPPSETYPYIRSLLDYKPVEAAGAGLTLTTSLTQPLSIVPSTILTAKTSASRSSARTTKSSATKLRRRLPKVTAAAFEDTNQKVVSRSVPQDATDDEHIGPSISQMRKAGCLPRERVGKRQRQMNLETQHRQQTARSATENSIPSSQPNPRVRMFAPQPPKQSCQLLYGLLSSDEKCEVIQELAKLLNDDELVAVTTTLMYMCLVIKDADLVKFMPMDFVKCLVQALHGLYESGDENVLYFILKHLLVDDMKSRMLDLKVKDLIAEGQMSFAKGNSTERDNEDNDAVDESLAHVEKFVETITLEHGIDAKQSGNKKKQSLAKVGSKHKPFPCKRSKKKQEFVKSSKKVKQVAQNVKDIAKKRQDDEAKDPTTNTDGQKTQEVQEVLVSLQSAKDFMNVQEQKDHLAGQSRDDCTEAINQSGSTEKPVTKKRRKSRKDWIPCGVGTCPRKFSTKEKLETHKMNYHTVQKCEICQLTFGSRSGFLTHERSLHKTEEQKVCSQCGKGFAYPSQLELHILIKHKGVKPFLCQFCGRGFADSRTVKDHVTQVHQKEKPHACKYCPEVFSTYFALSRHRKKTHMDVVVKKTPCRVCNEEFNNRWSLNKHINDVHQNKGKAASTLCSHCGKVFCNAYTLRKHIETVHIGRRDYQCEICKKTFTSNVHLQEHKGVHDREPRFTCKLCGQGFIHRASYKNHVFLHEQGTGQLKCPVCSKTFDLPTYLRGHIRRVHKGMNVKTPGIKMPESRLPDNRRVIPIGDEMPSVTKPESHLPNDLRVTAIGTNNDVDLVDQREDVVRPTGKIVNAAVNVVNQERSPPTQAGNIVNIERNENLKVIDDCDISNEVKGMRCVEVEVNGLRQTVYVPNELDDVQVADQVMSLASLL